MHCLDRFTVLRKLCIHTTESGFTEFLDIIHILEWTVQLCKHSEYLYTNILCDWISKGSQDKDIPCYRALNR